VIEQTLSIVKPDAVERNLENRIKSFFKEKNLKIVKNKKVFLSPHASIFTEECAERMGIETIQNIIDFFDRKLDKSMIVKL